MRIAAICLLLTAAAAAQPAFDKARELQQAGKLADARAVLREAAPAFRAAGDIPNLARALSAASRMSVSLGDNRAAIGDGRLALQLHRNVGDSPAQSEDLNTLGLAHLYLGEYAAAIGYYREALELDRVRHDGDGEAGRLNNIANVFYFQGRYSDALRAYDEAMTRVDAATGEPWSPARRQLTLANLAALYQRLGKEHAALDVYRRLQSSPQSLPPRERAQLLLNLGVLYRRLGDPVKALDLYREAQGLFALERHRDGEIGAWRSIGIARAIDLDDLPGALTAFERALKLAAESSDARGNALATLYRSEVLRRMGRLAAAAHDARSAFETARAAGLAEEQWKALFAMGRIAEAEGDAAAAAGDYEHAVEIFEAMRAGLRAAPLRTEFLADKRDVYDALIANRLNSGAKAAELFDWFERSRSRALRDRTARDNVPAPALSAVQARLAPDTVLLDLWVGGSGAAVLWANSHDTGVMPHSCALGRLQTDVAAFTAALAENASAAPAACLLELLDGLPLATHIVIVPDGPLSTVPFESLTLPGSNTRLIEQHDVTYLPSALTIAAGRPQHWLWPWQREMLALGDPPIGSNDALAGGEQWQRLAASADEVTGVAQELTGRSEIHLGAAARKAAIVRAGGRPAPLLHLSTHALVDAEIPERSRILLAPDRAGGGPDYLFQEEVSQLDLQGVDLAVLSACDTARGKLIRGEGVASFSRAFLAAGAASTVTSLWRVADRPTAAFMKQFYYFLNRGQTKSEALRSAKLAFLRSHSPLSEPRHWAAFVLNGAGWQPGPRVIPWSVLFGGAGLLTAAVAIAFLQRATTAVKGENSPVAVSAVNPKT